MHHSLLAYGGLIIQFQDCVWDSRGYHIDLKHPEFKEEKLKPVLYPYYVQISQNIKPLAGYEVLKSQVLEGGIISPH